MTAFPLLQKHQFMSLETLRKSGAAVVTPVWFAQEGETLYVYTSAKAGKLKRIRNNPLVRVAPCTASGNLLGDYAEGRARELPENEHAHANGTLNRKYGLQKRLISFINRIRGGKATFLEITPR